MNSEQVTKAWEVTRDTLHGFKEPTRKAMRELDRYVVTLESDNAKLRGLVKAMFGRIEYECRCCSIFCSDWDEDNECCSFRTCARELGVEVDG